MISIILLRILFYIFLIIFYSIIIYTCIESKKGNMWSGKKSLFFIFFTIMSFLLAMYFMFSENNRLIKYHLKNKSYHEICGIIDGFNFSENRSSSSRKPTILEMNGKDYITNHFYSYENFDKYEIGDKVCIRYIVQFQHIKFYLPSDRLILYITEPNSNIYENHIRLID